MKLSKKIVTIVILVCALALIACGTPPPPVSQSQLETARAETLEAEQRLADLLRQLQVLEAEFQARQELFRVLQEMLSELE